MPETIDLRSLKPQDIKVEKPETISLAGLKPEEIKVEQEVRPRRKLDAIDSGLSGLAQGATFGFSDEAVAGARAGLGALGGEGKFSDLYEKEKTEQRAYIDAAKADNPKAFMGGELGGALGTAFVPGLGWARGGSALGKVGAAALGGGLTGAGLSEADPTKSFSDLKKFTGEVAGGATIGAATQGVLGGLGSAFAALKPTNLKKFAESKAVKAAGGMTAEMKKLKKDGELHKYGRELLDKKIVTMFSSLDDVAERSGALAKDAGEKIGDILSGADDLVKEANSLIDEGKLLGFLPDVKVGANGMPTKGEAKAYINDTFQASMKRVAERIRADLIEPNANEPALRQELKKLTSLADDYASLPNKTLAAGNKSKGTFGKKVNFDSETVPQSFKQDVYTILKDEIDTTIGKIGNLEDAIIREGVDIQGFLTSKLPNMSIEERNQLLSGAWSKAKKDYGLGVRTEEMALNRAGGVAANRSRSLTDSILQAAGIASGGGLNPVAMAQGEALSALNQLQRKYGATIQAVGADRLADILLRAPNKLGEFGNLLEKAAKSGPIPLLTTHRMLMKDPNYQNILYNFEPQERGLRMPEQRPQGFTLPRSR